MNEIDSFAIGVFIGFAVTVVLFRLLMRRHNKQLDEITESLEKTMGIADSLKKQTEDMASMATRIRREVLDRRSEAKKPQD